MKKGKMIVSMLALLLALGGLYAFKANETLPGDLYYFNSLGDCLKAPCEISNNTNNPCGNSPLYSAPGCATEYTKVAWTTDGGN